MVFDGDVELAKKLVNPAKKVIDKGSSVSYEPFEKRVELWNEIKQNQDTYEDGECGTLLDDLDRHYKASFDVALLILAKIFKEKEEEFPQAQIFSDEEFDIYERIEKYNVFEINSKDDIKKKVVTKDNDFLGLLEEYYINMDEWVEETIDKSEMRLNLRYYLKKKWGEYKQKINQAVNELNREYDWLGTLINEWKSKTEKITEEIHEEFREKEEDMQSLIDEIKGMKENIEKGSRFVEMGEAKFYEHNFIGRTKNKLHEKIEISGEKYKVQGITEGAGEDVTKYFDKMNEKDIKNLPENKYIIARLRLKKIFTNKSILLKAVFCSRIDNYARYGVDIDPAELVDINPLISNAMDQTQNDRMLLFIASPTGFTTEVEKHISGEDFHKNFLSVVSVCLYDLETDKLVMNPHDKTAEKFKEMFVLQTDEEKLAKARKCVEDILIEKDHVRLDQAIEMCGDKKIVKKIFYNIRDEKGYKVRGVKKIGLVLVRE